MAEIVKLADYRVQALIRDGFEIWHQKFDGPFDAHTCLKDLSAWTLYRLGEPGDESTEALYGLIIGFLGHGETLFNDLEARIQSLVIDIHLFLADHIRFEMMARLGWLAVSVENQFSLFEMVSRWEHAKASALQNPPLLSKNHPEYPHYQGLIERDQQVFIRRLFPAAMEAFKKANGL